MVSLESKKDFSPKEMRRKILFLLAKKSTTSSAFYWFANLWYNKKINRANVLEQW